LEVCAMKDEEFQQYLAKLKAEDAATQENS
jgi:hypothetical protein